MVFFLIGPALLLSAAIVYMVPRKDPSGKPLPRHWPLIWLLFWLGIFFVRVWSAIFSLLLGVVGIGKFQMAANAFSSMADGNDGGDRKHGVFFHAMALLFVAIAGYFALKYLMNEKARRNGESIPFP